ncbi:MAG TPA: radical SAM protein [Terriglobales bacterium]|nr:radical SAM protein [Terriglobales bacterium]
MSIRTSDVLFVFPPGPRSGGCFNAHLGVAYLQAVLSRGGMATAQYLNANPGTIDAVAADIIRQKCPIIGFSVYDTNAHLSIAIAESIKHKKPGVRIVFGGPAVTFNAQPLMERNGVIDICVIGEAEETAAPIFAKLLGGGAFDEAQPGVAFRRDKEVVCTALPRLAGSRDSGVSDVLDSIPSPYLSGILTDGKEGVLTGRGCTHRCQYCCFAALGRQRLRLHSVDRVVAELECIAENQKRTGSHFPVPLFDDALTLVPTRAKALCQAIADRKLKLTLSCITRADTIDEELIGLMRAAGINRINFGLESSVPSVLRATGKVRPPDWHDPDLMPERRFVEQVRSAVHLARKYGLDVSVNIILGLPTETLAEGAETLRFVKELPINLYFHNFLWVYPGTPLWATHEQYRIACTIDKTGLPKTTEYAYEVKSLKPGPKCELEQEAQVLRLLATDMLYSCEPSPPGGKGIGAVVLETGELSPEIAVWLRDNLTVGSVVLQIYPPMKRGEWWRRLDRDRGTLRDHLVPCLRYIQVRPKKKIGKDERWELTSSRVDVYRIHNPELLSIVASAGAAPLISWAKGRKAKASMCEVAEYLRNPSELLRLMDRIETDDGPSPLRLMPVPPHVKYPARWLRGTAPPCLSLARAEVNVRGEVRCCRQGEPIGKVGDTSSALSKRLADLASAVERRRGCAACRNEHCPRCPFPGIDDRAYCQIMTNQERAQRALDWMWVYSRIPLFAALVRNG